MTKITKKTPDIDKRLEKVLKEWKESNPVDTRTRLECNREILLKIEDFLESNPDLRFIQALWGLGIIERDTDKFYEESLGTLKKLKD